MHVLDPSPDCVEGKGPETERISSKARMCIVDSPEDVLSREQRKEETPRQGQMLLVYIPEMTLEDPQNLVIDADIILHKNKAWRITLKR